MASNFWRRTTIHDRFWRQLPRATRRAILFDGGQLRDEVIGMQAGDLYDRLREQSGHDAKNAAASFRRAVESRLD